MEHTGSTQKVSAPSREIVHFVKWQNGSTRAWSGVCCVCLQSPLLIQITEYYNCSIMGISGGGGSWELISLPTQWNESANCRNPTWGKTQTHPTQKYQRKPSKPVPECLQNWTVFIAREEEQGGRKQKGPESQLPNSWSLKSQFNDQQVYFPMYYCVLECTIMYYQVLD